MVRVVKRGNPPKSGTDGVTVCYELTNYNTSQDKSSVAESEDHITSGNLIAVKGLFMAEAIQGIHIYHNGACNSYQTAKITVKTNDGRLIANANLTIPAFDEFSCVKCHESATVSSFNDILTKHDLKYATKLSSPANQPVVCAVCHTGSAHGNAATDAKENLAKAIHDSHANRKGITCNDCHVSKLANTDPNLTGKAVKEDCISCHGEMNMITTNSASIHAQVASQPPCETCHIGLNWTNPEQIFYGKPLGKGNPFCIACHQNRPSTTANLQEPIKY
jgi:nitrate/TMAO reductase-like tetraheme cytochrome c subunit